MIYAVWSKEIDSLLCIGQPLEASGVSNWALDQLDALHALDSLYALGIAVAGGDVYRRGSGGLETTYDDWYCNKEIDEPMSSYVERSIGVARRYISSYSNSEGGDFFALVPSVR